MFRIAVTALAIYLLWKLLRWAFAGARKAKPAVDRGATLAAEMVACSRCGTFVVRSETVSHRGTEYCSESCAHGN